MLTPVFEIQNNKSIRDQIGQYQTEHDPEVQLKRAEGKIDKILTSSVDDLADNDLYDPVTIHEFSNGILMCETLYPQHKTFAIEMMRQLQKEYNCQSASEKATCELTTISFLRALEIKQLMKESLAYQQELTTSHGCGSYSVSYGNERDRNLGCRGCNRSKIEMQKYTLFVKQLDQANRHYLAAIQTLRMMKHAPLQITVKANTAIVGQNQVVQSNNHV